ncbi:MAG TPA: hypothetical protein VKD70_08015 [Candidatus Acidoferrum sp.]|nr:hypothetical protein [Candidatus Acidoferrum sp.]
MKKGVSFFAIVSSAALISSLTASSPTVAQTAPQPPRNLQLTPIDTTAAEEATIVFQHVHPANTDAGAAFTQNKISTPGKRANSTSSPNSSTVPFIGTNGLDQNRFPADLSYFGGAVVPFAQSHPIFLLPHGSCPVATCWGNPESFLNDFGFSDLARIIDQYVGAHASNRYTLGDDFSFPYTPPATPLTDGTMRAIVHAAVLASGERGYEHIFHVFLPPGQDECFSSAATVCYSPDKPSSFVFCAYHNSVTFSDVGHVLYTVEPFQNVPGCQVRPGTPNGQLIDSTNSNLSHELIETITDPDGDAWFNFTTNSLAGQEIADECQFLSIIQVSPTSFAVFNDPTVFTVGKHLYATQPEYNNLDHACGVSQ